MTDAVCPPTLVALMNRIRARYEPGPHGDYPEASYPIQLTTDEETAIVNLVLVLQRAKPGDV